LEGAHSTLNQIFLALFKSQKYSEGK